MFCSADCRDSQGRAPPVPRIFLKFMGLLLAWLTQHTQKCFKWGKKKTNKHKEFWRDTARFMSRLSPGHVPSVPSSVPSVPRTFCPLNVNFHINRPKTSRVSLGRPEFIRGTLPGHSDHQIPLCDFSLSVLSLSQIKGYFQNRLTRLNIPLYPKLLPN